MENNEFRNEQATAGAAEANSDEAKTNNTNEEYEEAEEYEFSLNVEGFDYDEEVERVKRETRGSKKTEADNFATNVLIMGKTGVGEKFLHQLSVPEREVRNRCREAGYGQGYSKKHARIR